MTTVLVPLTQGKFALIDEADYPLVCRYKWQVHIGPHTCYAATRLGGRKRTQTLWMHKLICLLPAWATLTDHINLDGLDNRRCNLRPATKRLNAANTNLYSRNTSGFRGVSGSHALWQAMAGQKFIGNYPTAEEAARAYDKRARELFGDFARLNFPD